MKQFKKIFAFELKNYMVNKVFVGVTLAFMIIIAGVMFFPRIAELFEGDPIPDDSIVTDDTDYTDSDIPADDLTDAPADDSDDREGLPVVLLSCTTQQDLLYNTFKAAFWDYDVRLTDLSQAEIEKQIQNGEVEFAFLMDGLTSYKYLVDDLGMYDSDTSLVNELLTNALQISAMTDLGLSAEQADEILNIYVSGETVTLGSDQMNNFIYTYVMIMALYMVILLYGQMVATNVATEKSSRAMELLITSAKPTAMMFGKVLASCVAGGLQLIAIFGTAYVCFNINRSYWDTYGAVASFFDIPLSLLLYMLVFFVLGFLMYAFMFGAVGSTASKLEDINTSVMPITLLFIVGFFIVIFSISSGMVDNPVIKIASFVPFTSPMAMFTRIAMGSVPIWEIAVSIGILIISVVGVGMLAAKIYRIGVLMYGTPPKPLAILKAIKNA